MNISFSSRHIGPRENELAQMLSATGVSSIDELIDKALPRDIRIAEPLNLPAGISEAAYLDKLSAMAAKNKLYRSYIGMGYYGTHLPSVIKRNILENPSWYTSYTPYQAEISQGRLEALLNFQTVIVELTAMEVANASLLDEATAAAEAMMLMYNVRSREAVKAGINRFFIDEKIFPQTLDVMLCRAEPLGIDIIIGQYQTFTPDASLFGAMVQYPDAEGNIRDYSAFAEALHDVGAKLGVAADLMSLAVLKPPGQWGADVVVGSSQRFGIPIGYGGPHAAYFATRNEFKRNMPGRIIGVSVDVQGKRALRMALQTREQHIKRERATSNICTAQALLATMAGMYAVYHGQEGIRAIASQINSHTQTLAKRLTELGLSIANEQFFDTLTIRICNEHAKAIRKTAENKMINFRYGNDFIGISLDETVTDADVQDIVEIFSKHFVKDVNTTSAVHSTPTDFIRNDAFLQQPVFNRYHSETEMMRYIKKLERKDISLTHSMIPLGSCTMKLTSATTMFSLSWSEFGNIHPFVPKEQAAGYHEMLEELAHQLAVITGFDAVSFQPNSGAAGEYAGLRVIRAYLESIGQGHRNIVLLPSSAHGTNPASAIQCGYATVTVHCDEKGNIDMADFRLKAEQYKENLAATMITYPSTHGIFEADIRAMCDIIHACGGQVYLDGANLNAQVGLTNPGVIGADVCHLNLHKTFASPHGGGGPGVGPICVVEHLIPFLPSHPVAYGSSINTVSAAPFGSAGILPISYAYIRMLGAEGLTQSTRTAILNANYLASKLNDTYGLVYTGTNGRVGHELILECRLFKDTGVDETDIAKRLVDFGYHAPTLSFPVHGTLMVEPTESESKAELDRFIEVLDCIFQEIKEIESGIASKEDNVLKNAPHPEYEVAGDEWNHSYSRSKAAFPLDWLHENKFWVNVARVNNAHGDRNLVASLGRP